MKKKVTTPYNSLAQIYDLLMDHVDYNMWATYILKILGPESDRIRTVLDISGGTGEFIRNLDLPRAQLYIADISGPMLTQFKKKSLSAKVPAFINDVRKCAIKSHKFDLVLLLYDSLNYLPEITNVLAMLKEAYRILNKNGILIFDAVTSAHCQKYFNEEVTEQLSNEKSYHRKSRFDDQTNMQYTDFEVVVGNEVFYEQHIQNIYSLSDIKSAISKAKFDLNKYYDGFTQKRAKQYSDRVHFVCRKI